ncbi:MAG: Crp/Fnr family transcriptional regulator, partial [Flavobacteriaceae bacterium]|nr:Crp/Fnr family transcriptional regulator [Flavobacteriaceae bacterium]
MQDDLQRNFGYLFEDELLDEIKAIGKFQKIPEGSIIIDIGDYIKSMPLILTGSIKVMREDDVGDDLLLYFIEEGYT